MQRGLADQTATVVGQVVATVVDSVPAYRKLTEAQLREIEAITHWSVTRLTEMWIDGTRLGERDLTRFRGIGSARAADGRPLMAVLRAYRVAAVALTDIIVATAPPALTVDDLADLTRTLVGALDDLSEALFTGYQRTAGELAGDRARLLDDLVHDLITGRQTSPGALADRTDQLGVVVPATFGLLVAGPRGSSAAAGDLASLGGFLSTVRGGLAVVLLPTESGDVALPSRWRGCLLDATTPAALPGDYRLASAAVGHAPTEAYARRRLLDRGDALTVAVLRGEPAVERARLHTAVLGPLLDARNARLFDGLRAYARHGSATEAAAALGLHPQSMRHRLRRITELTGRRLDDSWDRLVLDVARVSLEVLA